MMVALQWKYTQIRAMEKLYTQYSMNKQYKEGTQKGKNIPESSR